MVEDNKVKFLPVQMVFGLALEHYMDQWAGENLLKLSFEALLSVPGI